MNNDTIMTTDFLKDLLIVLHEAFEGSPPGAGSAFLDQGIGVLPTLDEIDYEMASDLSLGTSIAAHTEHSKFYIDRLCEFMTGRQETVNWEQSWLIETVNEEEWNILRKGVRKSYEKLLHVIAEIKIWNLDNIGDPIAVIAHTAYHLGAIRHALKALELRDEASSAGV